MKDQSKFKPRRINNEMPPIFPYQAWLRNIQIVDCGTGVHAENPDGLIIENLTTRRTPRPVVIKGGRRVYLRGLDFQL